VSGANKARPSTTACVTRQVMARWGSGVGSGKQTPWHRLLASVEVVPLTTPSLATCGVLLAAAEHQKWSMRSDPPRQGGDDLAHSDPADQLDLARAIGSSVEWPCLKYLVGLMMRRPIVGEVVRAAT